MGKVVILNDVVYFSNVFLRELTDAELDVLSFLIRKVKHNKESASDTYVVFTADAIKEVGWEASTVRRCLWQLVKKGWIKRVCARTYKLCEDKEQEVVIATQKTTLKELQPRLL